MLELNYYNNPTLANLSASITLLQTLFNCDLQESTVRSSSFTSKNDVSTSAYFADEFFEIGVEVIDCIRLDFGSEIPRVRPTAETTLVLITLDLVTAKGLTNPRTILLPLGVAIGRRFKSFALCAHDDARISARWMLLTLEVCRLSIP